MAASLNKTRKRDTALVIIATFFVIIFSQGYFGHNRHAIHALLEIIGFFMVCGAALGRIFTTAFVGGFKNKFLVKYGPFSICRNPLYFFSFIGVVGIGLISGHILLIIFTPLSFLAIYLSLIKREEVYLTEKFGKEYLAYIKSTPRFFPKFSLYHAPHIVEMSPKNLLNAIKDSIMWFLIFPIIELLEVFQDAGIIHRFFYIP